MAEKCFCHFNGFRVKDSVARKQIADLTNELSTANANILALSNTINTMNTFMNALAGDVALLKSRVTLLENSSGSGDSGNTGGGSGDNGGNTGGGSGDNGGNTGGDSGNTGGDSGDSQLAAPTVSLSGDVLMIKDNTGGAATHYEIYGDGTLINTTGTGGDNSCYLPTFFPGYGSHTLKVKACATGYLPSDFSNIVTYTKTMAQLEAPSISVNGNYLYIVDNSAGKATSYEIFKDGASITTILSTSCYLPTYISADGTYTITAKAKANNYKTSNSSNSVNYTKTTVDTRKTLSGKWLVDETPSIGDVFEDGLQESFESSVGVGEVGEINAINIYAGENAIYYEGSGSGGDEFVYNADTEKWICMSEVEGVAGNRPGLMRQLNFGSGVKVSDDFYNWFTDNATQVTSFPEAPVEETSSVYGTYKFKSLYDNNSGELTAAGEWLTENFGKFSGKFKIVDNEAGDIVYTILDFHDDPDEGSSVYGWTDENHYMEWDDDGNPGWVGDWHYEYDMSNIIVLEQPTGKFAEMLANCCTKIS